MVSNHDLLKLSSSYIEDYLLKFVNQGKIEDLVEIAQNTLFNPNLMNNPFYANIQNQTGEKVIKDLHQTRYNGIINNIKETDMSKLIESVNEIQNPIVIDIASKIGERFGLFIAGNNSQADVFVYNPFDEIPLSLKNQDYLRQDLERRDHFKPKTKLDLDLNQLESSIQKLYEKEGLENINFKRDYFTEAELNKIQDNNPGRRIVLFSHRTPTYPEDITYKLAKMATKEGVDLIMTPLVNMPIGETGDPIVHKINENYMKMFKPMEQNSQEARDRIYNVMTAYYALTSAIISNANIFKNYEMKPPMQQPNFIISTLTPKSN